MGWQRILSDIGAVRSGRWAYDLFVNEVLYFMSETDTTVGSMTFGLMEMAVLIFVVPPRQWIWSGCWV